MARTFPGKQRILGSKLGETVFTFLLFLFGKCNLFSIFSLPSFLPFFFSIFSLSLVLFLLTPTVQVALNLHNAGFCTVNVQYTTHILSLDSDLACVAVLSCFSVGPINK